MARPTKLTPELATGIVTLIQHGVHPPIAAGAYGVDRITFYEWLARGEGRDPDRPARFAADQRTRGALTRWSRSRVRATFVPNDPVIDVADTDRAASRG